MRLFHKTVVWTTILCGLGCGDDSGPVNLEPPSTYPWLVDGYDRTFV